MLLKTSKRSRRQLDNLFIGRDLNNTLLFDSLNCMNDIPILTDFTDPLVQTTALQVIGDEQTVRGKLRKLFYFVRDEIQFGFPLGGDFVKASDTIRSGVGQCNTKGTLFLALCKALEIPARLHFATVNKQIQQGLFTGIAFRLMPSFISHAWLEVKVDERWCRIDSYINDLPFYMAAKDELQKRSWDMGFSIASSGYNSGIEFDLDENSFVQMNAVKGDHGIWDEPADYYRSSNYKNRPSKLRLLAYRFLVDAANRQIERIRARTSDKNKEDNITIDRNHSVL